jgi:hypothetical protein
MDNVIGNNSIEDLFKILALGASLLIFWIIETVRRNNKKEVLWIAIFPPSILFFIVKYWEETRGKCFFVALFIVMVFFIGAVTHHNFAGRLGLILETVALWPYYLYLHFKH